MSWYPDPDALRAQAARLVAHAQHLHNLGRTIAAEALAAPWQGPAADQLRLQVHELERGYLRNADAIIAAALTLRAHAANVEEQLDALKLTAGSLFGPLGGPILELDAALDLRAIGIG